MQKKVLFKDIDIKVLNLANVLEEVRKKELTGFLKVVYWDSDEYLLFFNGIPKRAVTINSDGRRLVLSPENFKVKEKEGSASLVETTLDDLIAFQENRREPDKDGPLVFFPLGTITQEPVSLSFLDVNKEFALAERSHLDGYVAFYTDSKLLGCVIFTGGKPVSVQAGNGTFGEQAVNYINSVLNTSTTYMSMYSTEHELLSFLYSMTPDRVKKDPRVLENYQSAKNIVEKEKLNSIVIVESEGIVRYDLFFRGQRVENFVREKGFFITDEELKERLSVKAENLPESKVHLYTVNFVEKPEPIEVQLSAVASGEGEPEVASDIIAVVKADFIRLVGPVGRLLWDKIIKDEGLKETSMTRHQFKSIIDKLVKEIPEESGRKEFLEKIKSDAPDII